MAANIAFKNTADEAAWPVHADARLVALIEALCDVAAGHGVPMPLIVTSFWRPADRDSVHAYGRGADVRTRDWPYPVAQRLADEMNARWRYSTDPARAGKVAFYYEPDAPGGPHMHVQVPPPGLGPIPRSCIG